MAKKVVLVYFQPFRHSLLLNDVSQLEIEKNSLKPLFWEFKVIEVDVPEMLVASACYDMMLVMSVSICNHFHVRQVNSASPSPSGIKFCREILETLSSHTVYTWTLYFTWAWIGAGLWQTDGQMDRISV